MRFHLQAISGVWVIEPEPFADDRGVLRRHFCAEEFAAHGLCPRVMQGNISENFRRHTLRGFHYQNPPHAEAKTVSVLRGAIYVIVADIRPESPTQLKWVAQELSDVNRLSLHLSAGCAMGMLTLADNTIVHYYASEPFAAHSYNGVRYNDPLFNFAWPAEPMIFSEKDRNYPDFKLARR